MHMQDVYASEKNEIGTWAAIGYDKPTSTVFEYTNGTTGEADFNANPVTALDGIDGDWKVGSTINSSTGKTTHTASMPTGADKLTPNFTNIGGGAAAASSSN